MHVLESASSMSLTDPRVWICGDWHGNVRWAQRLIPAMRRFDSQMSTILHVGDWWMESESVDYWCARAGIERVLVTLGNHEPYAVYKPLMDEYPGQAVKISRVTWLLPRPFRFEICGRTFVSLGGAASVDRLSRRPGRDWWPDEVIRDEHVSAVGDEPADVLITHESPAKTPVQEVINILSREPSPFPDATLAESAASREQVQKAWDAVRPSILVHGHMHVDGRGQTVDGRRVVSLGMDGDPSNVVLLVLASLEVEIPVLRGLA